MSWAPLAIDRIIQGIEDLNVLQVLGGTSVCTPTSFIQSLRELSITPTEIRSK